MFRRPLAILFALIFSLCVFVLDFTAAGSSRVLGLYGWAAVVFAAVLAVVAIQNWRSAKGLIPPGILRPREAAFFVSGLVAAASIAARAMDALPVANTFVALPNWPSFYFVIFLLIVVVGAFNWLSGRCLMPWGFFALLVLAAVNGQLFNLAAGGYGIFFGFCAAVFFFQTESLAGGKPRLSYVGAALIIFILAALVSSFWSQDWGGSFRTVFFLANGFLIFIIFAREIEAADVLALPAAVVWALLLSEVAFEVALAAKFATVWRWIPPTVPREDLFWTMGVSRNAISTYFVAALPLLLISVKSPKPAAPRWLLWTQIAFSVAVPALTLSKSGILGLLVVLWFVVAFRGAERRMNLKLLASGAVLLFVVLVLLVVLVIPGGAARFLNPLAYTTHLVTFKVAFEALRDHLLTGVGLGSNLAWVAQAGALSPDELVAFPEFLAGHSHSIFAEVFGMMGLLGVVAFFIVIQTAAWAGANLVKVESDRVFFGMINASLAGAGAILTVALGLALLSPIPIVVFVGFAMYEGGLRRRGLAATSPKWLTAVFVVMVAVAAALGLLHVASRQDIARGERLRKAGDFGSSSRCFTRAAFWAPWDPEPHERLAAYHLGDARGDLERALASYRAAARRARGNAAYLEKLGLLSWVFGANERAGHYLARAVEADPAGLIGGNHQTSYALFLASRSDTSSARRLLTEGVLIDPWLCRRAAFVVCGPEGSRNTYLRYIDDAGGGGLAEKVAFSLLAVRGYESRSLSRVVGNVPPSLERDLCLEDIYAAEFRKTFSLNGADGRIAGAAAYRLGEGYAETRLRGNAIFAELGAVPVIGADDADVGLALFASRHLDLERHRWEIQSLLGMALLANRLGELLALPDITAEFKERAEELRRSVAGAGEPREAKIDRLKYYYSADEQPEWDLALGDTLLGGGDERQARRYYKRALQLLLAGEVDVRDERLLRAVRGILKCRALATLVGGDTERPGLPYVREASPAAYVADARAEEFYGEYKKALVILREGVERYPDDVGLTLVLADYYEGRFLPGKAIGLLANSRVAHELPLWRARAEITARHGDRVEGLKLLEAVEREYPGDLVTYLTAARIYAEGGDLGGGLAALGRARERIPRGSLWASRYGAVLLAAGDVEGAAEYYGLARKLNPFDLEPYVAWGEALCRLGRPEEALPLLVRAVAVDADSTWARLALAGCYRELGRYAGAERVYEEGIAREGLGSPVTLGYDDYFKQRRDVRSRRRVLEAALRKDPANATLRVRLGEIALAAGETDKGFALLREAVALEPASPEANAALGYYYRKHGEASAAIGYFEQARDAAPGVANYHILLADALIETGRYREALAELEAVEDPARMAKALVLRAKAYYNLGERGAASAAAGRALELEPGIAEAEEFVSDR